MHKLTYKYRLHPTASQVRHLEQTLEECRWVYNQTLEYRKTAWEKRQQSVSLYDTIKLLPTWKAEHPTLLSAHSQVLQNAQVRVDLAFQAFFRRVKVGEMPGYPRFRGRDRYDSFTFSQSGFSLIGNRLRISKVGEVKIKLHRPLEGRVKTLTIRKQSTGKWFACFAVEIECDALPISEKIVGIDVGLTSFATLSDGSKVANPRFFRKSQKALAKAQRKLSKAAKGTPERTKCKLVAAHVHERVANRRINFAHQLSREWVNTYGAIAFEKLNIDRMLKNHCLAKSLSDAAWDQTITLTQYKAECAGRVCVLVDPRNTSKACSRCGTLVEKSLSVRVHSCPSCGLVLDRDENAAINILRRGLASLGRTLP